MKNDSRCLPLRTTDLIAPSALGLIESLVSPIHQISQRILRLNIGSTDAECSPVLDRAPSGEETEGMGGNLPAQALGHLQATLGIGGPQEDAKFLTPDPSQQVLQAQVNTEYSSELGE